MILEYLPQKDSPQVYFIQNRVTTQDLTINETNYKKRKLQFADRVRAFTRYIEEQSICRSKLIGNYFGDNKMDSCGVCDNCLDHHNTELSVEEFDKVHQQILHLVQAKPYQSQDLLLQLSGVKKEKALKVVRFLQAENKIEVDKNGIIKLK